MSNSILPSLPRSFAIQEITNASDGALLAAVEENWTILRDRMDHAGIAAMITAEINARSAARVDRAVLLYARTSAILTFVAILVALFKK